MQLKNIIAIPHPDGNRIDLQWVNPDLVQFPGVRIMRREGTYPTSPIDGIVVVEGVGLHYAVNEKGEGLYYAADKNLKGETVYYYTLFPYKGAPPAYQIDLLHNRAAAMATAPYNLAGQMMELLPAIYHRYDTVMPRDIPPGMQEEDKKRGQLRRFLDLPGKHLDQLYSFARAMLNLHNIDRVDGRLLPLLAQWIGWDTDFKLKIAGQRNELRNALAWYETTGVIPTAEATIKRLSGWESRTKEFVHNVFLSNQPERLNLWERQRDSSGAWSEPTAPLSLNFAYEGRPAAVRDGNGTLWLFYHTPRNGRWDIWYKTLSVFSLAAELENDLNTGAISTGLQQVFAHEGFSLSLSATIKKRDSEWLITDTENGEIYTVKKEAGQLNVYRWAPSQPLTNRVQLDKHPTAAVQGNTLWVFWDVYDETERKSHIHYRTRTGDVWSAIETNEPFTNTTNERKTPAAVVDHTGGLWLFWLEKVATRWQLQYNRHNGAAWGSAVSFPLYEGNDPGVQGAPFVLFHPGNVAPRLWVFWARREPSGAPGQTRWQIAFRLKQGIDPDVTADWSAIVPLPKTIPNSDYDDCEPAARANTSGNIELFWSSNRDGSWSIWSSVLDLNTGWGIPARVTTNAYSQRDPLPFAMGNKTLLIYRSNESLTYTSNVYRATETVDFRYAGSTTVDTRNIAKKGLWGQFEDFQSYTYDAGQTREDWYSRDTAGIYINPFTEDKDLIARNRTLVEKVLRQFLPIQVRPVFIITETVPYKELIYTYDFPATEPRIAEKFSDSIATTAWEEYLGLVDGRQDTVPDWIWLRSWSEEYANHHTVDFTATPIDMKFRTWHIGLKSGG